MRSAKQQLRVTLPDGREICYKSAMYTVLEVLRWIGEERFAEIRLTVSGEPLVSRNPQSMRKNYTEEIIPGWYYIRQGDTNQRYMQLRAINDSLNLGLKIEPGNFKAMKDPVGRCKCRKKSRLQVTMIESGEIIDYDSFRDVFITVIDKLDPYRVARIANIEVSYDQTLIEATDSSGSRHRMDEIHYLYIPPTANACGRLLDLLSKKLATNMKIEVLPYNA